MPAKKPTAAKNRKRPKPFDDMPAVCLEDMPEPRTNEADVFCSLVAANQYTPAQAFRVIRPHVKPESAKQAACKWAKRYEARIETMRQAAAQASQVMHGIDRGWIIGMAKQGFLTPLSEIGMDSIWCKKATVVMTEAGPKTTVEKDSPKDMLQFIARLTGFDKPEPTPAENAENAENAPQSVQALLASVLRILPGSPITRRVHELAPAETTIDTPTEEHAP